MTVEFLEDFRSEFQSEKQMTVELLKTFDQNSSRKSKWPWNSKTFDQNSSRKNKWPWNSKRLSIRIPVGKENDHGILKDFLSEFQSEKPNWQQNFWRIIQSSVLLIGKADNCQWEKTLINCEEKKISRTNLLSSRDPEFWHFGMKNLKYYYPKIPIYQILHIWVFHPF